MGNLTPPASIDGTRWVAKSNLGRSMPTLPLKVHIYNAKTSSQTPLTQAQWFNKFQKCGAFQVCEYNQFFPDMLVYPGTNVSHP